MKVFVTGASGFIGSAIVQELLGAGHQVLGLARSEKSAQALTAAGAEVQRGSIDDLESLTQGAMASEGVIHTAFNHDFSNFVASAQNDQRVIETLGESMAKNGGPLLVTSGTLVVKAKPGKPATEEDPALPPDQMPRALSEVAADEAASSGVRAFVLRPAHIHDVSGHGGALAWLIELAREKGFSAYATNGEQRWPACARPDAARLYRLAIEKGVARQRYHAVGEEGVRMCDIAEAIGRLQGVPVRSLSLEEASSHFGPTVSFVTGDGPASSALTRDWLGWTPTGNGMIADLNHGTYFEG